MLQSLTSLTSLPLPQPAEQFRAPRAAPSAWVSDCPRDTYERVGGAYGAAGGALAGPFVAASALKIGGVVTGHLLGGHLGMIVGGVVGYALVGLLHRHAGRAARTGAAIGASLGMAASKAAHAAGLPLRSGAVSLTASFSTEHLGQRLRDVEYSSHANLDAAAVDEFERHLQPGDVVLTHDARFSLRGFTARLLARGDFDEAMLYAGGGRALAWRDGRAAEVPLHDVLARRHAAVCVRPRYVGDQAAATLDAARSAGHKRGAAAILTTLGTEAPQVKFRTRGSVLGVVAEDLLRTTDADVTQQVGTTRTLHDSYVGRFV